MWVTKTLTYDFYIEGGGSWKPLVNIKCFFTDILQNFFCGVGGSVNDGITFILKWLFLKCSKQKAL